MDPTSWLLDTSSPDDVARASFSIVRRGFDPVEVQGFARSVSAEIVRLQAQVDELSSALQAAQVKAAERITEATVAGFLGEETSRMLEGARRTAGALETRAWERAERLETETQAEAARLMADARGEAERTRHEADQYSRHKRAEADHHAEVTRRQADEYSARTGSVARADAEAVGRQAAVDAERILEEAREHRATMLRELTRRRDLACAQVRAIVTGREMVVDAIQQVRLTAVELIGGLEDISVSPADFVSLDPEIEGPGLVVDKGASLTVRRMRQVKIFDVDLEDAQPEARDVPLDLAPAAPAEAVPSA